MTSVRIEIKWALLFTGMMLLWVLLERVAGLHNVNIGKHDLFSRFVAIPAIAIYVFALLDKRRNHYGGTMNYTQGFVAGLWLTLFVTILSPLTQYVTATLISPDYFDNAIAFTVSTSEKTLQEAERYFNLRSYMMMTVLFTPVMGIATTAIVAIFTRRGRKAEVSG